MKTYGEVEMEGGGGEKGRRFVRKRRWREV